MITVWSVATIGPPFSRSLPNFFPIERTTEPKTMPVKKIATIANAKFDS